MEKKLTRRESRETAFLTAFAATFEPEEPTVPAEEHAAPDAFANQLLAAMNDHAAELDEIITAHLKGWTLSRVPRVSLVALRLALAEMLYGDEQKPGVAINEAVELVKKYGAEDDYQFVNGLLGVVARERGETTEPQCWSAAERRAVPPHGSLARHAGGAGRKGRPDAGQGHWRVRQAAPRGGVVYAVLSGRCQRRDGVQPVPRAAAHRADPPAGAYCRGAVRGGGFHAI